jgi:hypothetical protein
MSCPVCGGSFHGDCVCNEDSRYDPPDICEECWKFFTFGHDCSPKNGESDLDKLKHTLKKKERLLERIRVKAMQTGWMDKLTDCLFDELNDVQ